MVTLNEHLAHQKTMQTIPRKRRYVWLVEVLWDFPDNWRRCSHIGCCKWNYPSKAAAMAGLEKHKLRLTASLGTYDATQIRIRKVAN